MAVEGIAVDASSANNGFNGKITLSVVLTCIVAASSGLIFGYDLGITGSSHQPFNGGERFYITLGLSRVFMID
ncbi:hypothetical protein D0Y65_036143 [Glycine soja]|uniref:Uncharacterized protein n=1 Tax=Glycine soja TaxID=3848 RepID=A0A445HD20_GLYSO|nr:hypothetical protein D0Y65_036143 [Glycine soja]